jgi:hypothetical protein
MLVTGAAVVQMLAIEEITHRDLWPWWVMDIRLSSFVLHIQ